MFHKFHILLRLCIGMLLLPVLAACSDSDGGVPVEYVENPAFRISLRVGDGSAEGRADGPSEKDGYAGALPNEYKIEDLTLLLYQDENGINGNDNTVIQYGFYTHRFSSTVTDGAAPYEKVYTSEIVRLEKPIIKGTYHAIAICNQGDLTRLIGKTLKEVRDLTSERICIYSSFAPEDYLLFGMSSAKDETINVLGTDHWTSDDDTEHGDLIEANLHVQRMAARIDFSPGDNSNPYDKNTNSTNPSPGGEWNDWNTDVTVGMTPYHIGNAYRFPVMNSTSGEFTGDFFYMTAATPVNIYNGAEYVLKRVSQFENTGIVNCLGNETFNSEGYGNNFVLDPLTTLKNSANFSTLFTGKYLLPYADVYAQSENDPLDNTVLQTVKKVASGEGLSYKATYKEDTSKEIWYRPMWYTRENTVLTSSPKQEYATGIIFSGFYAKKQQNDSYTYTIKTYSYFIRHTDPSNTNSENIPMKYGIVRNCNYRLYIRQVNSLGLILIEVKDWTPVNVPDIQV